MKLYRLQQRITGIGPIWTTDGESLPFVVEDHPSPQIMSCYNNHADIIEAGKHLYYFSTLEALQDTFFVKSCRRVDFNENWEVVVIDTTHLRHPDLVFLEKNQALVHKDLQGKAESLGEVGNTLIRNYDPCEKMVAALA